MDWCFTQTILTSDFNIIYTLVLAKQEWCRHLISNVQTFTSYNAHGNIGVGDFIILTHTKAFNRCINAILFYQNNDDRCINTIPTLMHHHVCNRTNVVCR